MTLLLPDPLELICLEVYPDDSDSDFEKVINANLAGNDFLNGDLDLGTFEDILEDAGENPGLVIASLEETLEFGWKIV